MLELVDIAILHAILKASLLVLIEDAASLEKLSNINKHLRSSVLEPDLHLLLSNPQLAGMTIAKFEQNYT